MMEFNGIKFATPADVAELQKNLNCNKLDMSYISTNEIRKRYNELLTKFTKIEGCSVVYAENCYSDMYKGIDGYSKKPSLFFGGVVMFVNVHDLTNGKAIELQPYGLHSVGVYSLDDNPEVVAAYKVTPNKVGIPTAKKLEQWAKYGQNLVNVYEKSKNKQQEHYNTNLQKLRNIKDVQEISEGHNFIVSRFGVICHMELNRNGSIKKEFRLDNKAASRYFEDCIEL